LASLHTLEGLMSWAAREEWRGVLADFIDRHTVQACRSAGIELSDLGDVVGEDCFPTIWGAAFEDLVSSTLPEGRNLADEYLKRRGWKESVGNREYIAALRRSVISLFEVSGVVPGESMLLRDLVRPGEPVRVFEKSGSKNLREWDRIATRSITIRGRAIISGTLMRFDHDTGDAVLASIRRVAEQLSFGTGKIAQEHGVAVTGQQIDGAVSADLLLSKAAPTFTNLWLDSVLKAVQGRDRPKLKNSDGEPLEIITLHFPFKAGVKVAQVRSALGSVPALRQETASFWNWLATSKPTRRAKSTKSHTFTTTMDDGAIVLGNVEIKARWVSLMVNSQARADRGQAILETALAGLVRTPLTERADLDQMMPQQKGETVQATGLSPEEERAVIRHALDDHYRRTLDDRIPILGNRTPRAAARTAKGRDQVVGWLKMLENHSAGRGADDPIGEYDFGWMWRELGVEELRR
jgi:hypothetical protein